VKPTVGLQGVTAGVTPALSIKAARRLRAQPLPMA